MASDLSQSLVKGTTPATTALFFQIAAGNGAPTTADQGVPLGMWRNIDAVAKEDNGGSFKARIWWWYEAAEVWVQDATATPAAGVAILANTTGGVVLNPGAASKVYMEVLTFGGAGHATGWIIGRGSLGRP